MTDTKNLSLSQSVMEDELILVDLLNREIGHAAKMETHVKGMLHRAFSVFLVHEGKMLIQQRAFDKYHSGGLWANACCSHPRYGEPLSRAVARRLLEELGIEAEICLEAELREEAEHGVEGKVGKALVVEEIDSFTYYSRYSETMHEYEYDHVFLGDYDGKIQADPAEIAETRWVDLSWLSQDMLDNPDNYSSWFLIACPKVLKYLSTKS